MSDVADAQTITSLSVIVPPSNYVIVNKVAVRVALRSLADSARELPVRLERNGTIMFQKQETVAAGETKVVEIRQTWKELRRWHVGSPQLYTIRAVAGNDDLADRTGFRTVEARNGRIWLNGEEIYLEGVNRHEEHPEWGFAFPPKLMSKDLDIILNAGCNAIRGAHYPQSQYWLDMLDERGVMN
jgi:beta-glucuronidase